MPSILRLPTLLVLSASIPFLGATGREPSVQNDCRKLRAAIEDLSATFPSRYPNAKGYLDRLAKIETANRKGGKSTRENLLHLQKEALLANPLLKDLPGLLLVKRRPKDLKKDGVFTKLDEKIGHSMGLGREIGMPSNHECNASLERGGYDNEICVLSPVSPGGKLSTLYRPENDGFVGDIDLHFDGTRLLFTRSDEINWKLWEIGIDGKDLRQVTRLPDDVDAMDACYLPDGRIIFGSTACYQSVPCWHGRKRVSNLFLMNANGSGVRQLCYDQDHDWHPVVLPSGQVLYQRWDYTGINHIYMRQLMTMNPDGTKQRAVYGSNSWYPNSLFFPKPIPAENNRLLCILAGYHGDHRSGQLVIVEPSKGDGEGAGIVKRISGRGLPIQPKVRDALVNADWPKFLHPFPLGEKYFLVSAKENRRSPWKIYLADVFDNLVPLHETPGYALLEPTPLQPRPAPPVIPDLVDLSQTESTVLMGDVYAGPGLAGVPRGTVKSLRVFAYHFGYPGLAGPDKIGYGGPWEAMRILGTTPVEADGSASFKIPANTPIGFQPLDAEGKAVQLMRSWLTAMPGEKVSCVGCHEESYEAVGVKPGLAARRAPADLIPWHGPARGFDFEREVQPVIDRHCVSCHDGSESGIADLRSEADGGKITPKSIGYVNRLHDDMLAATGGKLRYSPAYDVLVHYIRRVGIEDDVSLLTPGEYHADTSELIQMLQKGHHEVRLDPEGWDRLVTWIDLNGPCHGNWGDVFPVPDGAHQRRMDLRVKYGGRKDDPERVVETRYSPGETKKNTSEPQPSDESPNGRPLSQAQAVAAQKALGETRREIELPKGIRLTFVRVPAGRFLMGEAEGAADEKPPRDVGVEKAFWIGAYEISNAQYRAFDPEHDSGYYVKRRDRPDGKGMTLNDDAQPAVRVSWDRANAFCDWLSQRLDAPFALPTEEQWEYACRAGTDTPLGYGSVDDDFSAWGNMADRLFSTGLSKAKGRMMPEGGVTQVTGGVPHLLLEGAKLADTRYEDGFRVTAPIGSFRPNRWGLHDTHGNAAEWTSTETGSGEKVVRGGSFFDRPDRCRSSFRLGYPHWQRVFNVGFRVVCEELPEKNLEK